MVSGERDLSHKIAANMLAGTRRVRYSVMWDLAGIEGDERHVQENRGRSRRVMDRSVLRRSRCRLSAGTFACRASTSELSTRRNDATGGPNATDSDDESFTTARSLEVGRYRPSGILETRLQMLVQMAVRSKASGRSRRVICVDFGQA